MNLAVGQIIGGDFELVRPLGEGGMGVVWLATERPLGRNVALKIMRPSEGVARVRRFEREAHALAALNHPSIITVLRTGIDAENGLHYIATPAILLRENEIRHLCDEVFHCPYPAWIGSRGSDSGGRDSDSSEPSVTGSPLTLADLLDGGKALPEATVARIARDLAGALSAAHATGILHRDVKPSNILFDATGRAMLADFGLAKFTDAAATGGAEGGAGEPPTASGRGAVAPRVRDSISLDGSGTPKFLGSLSYAAPESFKMGAAAATPALDWYSLGAVIYEALTGDRPRSLRAPSSYDPAHISRAWDTLVRDLLEPDPSQRLANCEVFLRRLSRIGRRPRRWLGPALAVACIAAAVTIRRLTDDGDLPPGKPAVPPAPLSSPATSSAKWIPRGPTYLNQTPATYPPVTPAALQPPRQTNIWQGENCGPLQLLNTFAFPAVDETIASSISESRRFADTRPFFNEGDAAWSVPERELFLADGSHSNECAKAMDRAEKAYSAIIAKIDAVPISLGASLPICRAVALARRAWVDIVRHRMGGSDDLYAQALAGIGPYAEHDSEQYAPLLSWLLSERAYMKGMEGRFDESIPDLEEALTLLESNIIRSAPGCAIQEAVLHASLGGLYHAVGQNGKALDDTSEAIAIAEGILASNPSATNQPPTLQPFNPSPLQPFNPSTLQRIADFVAGCKHRRDEILKDFARQH